MMVMVNEAYLSRVPSAELLAVIETALADGKRVMVEGLADGVVYYSLLDAYEPAAVEVTESLPPQCSF